MKNPTAEVFAAATAMKADGKPNREIMAELGLSHSQLEIHLLRAEVKNGKHGGFLAQPDSATEKAAMIARARADGQSWGLIAIRFSEPESRTRKAFTEATGLDSKGLRIGKGGRYVSDEPAFYTGSDRAKLGTELDPAELLVNQLPDPNEEAKRTLARRVKAAEKRALKAAQA